MINDSYVFVKMYDRYIIYVLTFYDGSFEKIQTIQKFSVSKPTYIHKEK